MRATPGAAREQSPPIPTQIGPIAAVGPSPDPCDSDLRIDVALGKVRVRRLVPDVHVRNDSLPSGGNCQWSDRAASLPEQTQLESPRSTVAKSAERKDDERFVRAEIRSYFASASQEGRRALRALRETIRAAAPGAIEGFSYRLPCFRFEGRPLVWYGAFTAHCSLYPITGNIKRQLTAALRGYETSKGTVRFPLAKPMPVSLVRRLVKARVAEVRARAAARRR